MTTLALTGDVMLGRGVNEALRAMRPEEAWGDTMPLLLAADLRIINLECAITEHEQMWARTPKVFHFRADPQAVEVLRAARVNACSLANNHTLDFEEDGLLDTLRHLEATIRGLAATWRRPDGRLCSRMASLSWPSRTTSPRSPPDRRGQGPTICPSRRSRGSCGG